MTKLSGVEDRPKVHPATSHSNPRGERASLRVGDQAQLSVDDKERLWFEVVKVLGTGDSVVYLGRLRSVPLVVRLKMTDRLKFEPRHVIRVERATP